MKAITFSLLAFHSTLIFADPTVIFTRYDDDKVIISNEFVGTGTGKIDVSTIADTYADDKGIIRARKMIIIKAEPGNKGRCNAVVAIMRDNRIPKRVSLDTDICNENPTINLDFN